MGMVVGVTGLITISTDTESIVENLVATNADWTEVLRFLEWMADRQGTHLDSQKISEMVTERLGGF